MRARDTLPKDSASHEAVREYQDFLDNNELELACEKLEIYAESHEVSREFWLALRDAAAKMQLPTANMYKTNARKSSES